MSNHLMSPKESLWTRPEGSRQLGFAAANPADLRCAQTLRYGRGIVVPGRALPH